MCVWGGGALGLSCSAKSTSSVLENRMIRKMLVPKRRNTYRVLVWKCKRKKTLECPRRRWKNDIKMEQKR